MKYYQTIILVLAILFLSACGGGSSNGSNSNDNVNINENKNNSTSIPMVLGKSYTLKEGDVIIRDDENTTLLLETNIITGETVAILQEGSAYIFVDN